MSEKQKQLQQLLSKARKAHEALLEARNAEFKLVKEAYAERLAAAEQEIERAQKALDDEKIRASSAGELGYPLMPGDRLYREGGVEAVLEVWGPSSRSTSRWRRQYPGTHVARILTKDGKPSAKFDEYVYGWNGTTRWKAHDPEKQAKLEEYCAKARGES